MEQKIAVLGNSTEEKKSSIKLSVKVVNWLMRNNKRNYFDRKINM